MSIPPSCLQRIFRYTCPLQPSAFLSTKPDHRLTHGVKLAVPKTTRQVRFTSVSGQKFKNTIMAADLKPNSKRPSHKMRYFPDMTTALPSTSNEFRRVLWTGLYSQVVLMTVPVGGDIGEEIHTVDQILTFTSGTGLAQVGGEEQKVKAGDMVIVPAGAKHQFLNTGPNPLILYTVYSPAEHNATTVHKTKEQGDKAEEDGIDEPPAWSQLSKTENEETGLVG